IKEKEEFFQLATYQKMPIALERGKGAWVWTSDNERYLDLYGGHAVCATGHAHPKVIEAINNQAEKIIFYSNLVYSETRARASEKLCSKIKDARYLAFFCNSGTEANEAAMRIARLVTGKQEVISFSGSFHGRTADSISASFLGKYRSLGKPNVPFHIEAEFGDIDSVKQLLNENTAAIIIEPIQSMAGVRETSPVFFQQLRELCDQTGVCLIFDEVQTGMGRTGNWFFSGSDLAGGIHADLITLAKSLGSGVPVGACLVTEQIAGQIKENQLGTTFGGGMVAMAAVEATLDVIESENLLESAKAFEAYIREKLGDHHLVKKINGKGCLLGLELKVPAAEIHKKLLEDRIITGTSSDPNILRLLPPLVVKPDEAAIFVEALNIVEALN
ncbi:MAG TPA: aminotransferase class III-fold pyridoxal phosphate-dependent enzyme, partial [Pyrinomonadaceae bacterium]|nr:aminotransferase class III-fold pyridoxal phosphate-dependent enzyme [Pyrinomonadaceae bacterium]